jgi:hypothetical protein
MYISHIALGFSGALCFLVITGIMLYKLPVVSSLLAHADQAANNAVTATGVIANASAEQTKQAVAIERDIRGLAWHVDRTLLGVNRLTGSGAALLNTANDQLAHLGPLLDSIKRTSDAVPGTLSHLNDAADASRTTIAKVGDDADAVRARIEDQRITDLIAYLDGTAKHVEGISASGETIMANGAKVTTKLTNDFLKPVPWWKWPIQKANDILDIGAAAARHAP